MEEPNMHEPTCESNPFVDLTAVSVAIHRTFVAVHIAANALTYRRF